MKKLIFFLAAFAMTSVAFAEDAPALKFNGTVRLRTELNSIGEGATGGTPSTYGYQRYAATLAAKAKVNPDTDAEVGLSTGTGRNSTNITLGQNDNTYDFFLLSKAYLNWHGLENFNFYGGRRMNVFFTPGGTDLVWSTANTWDGVAVTYAYKFGNWTLGAGLHNYYIEYNGAATEASGETYHYMPAAQLTFKHQLDSMDYTISASTYQMPMAGLGAFGSFGGNTTAGTTYAYDYRLLNVGFELNMKFMSQPVTFAFDYVKNSAVENNGTGYLAGFKLGSNKKMGDWWILYNYRSLMKDAALASTADADSFGGNLVNAKGHAIKLGYLIGDNFSVALNEFMGTANIEEGATGYSRSKTQLDLAVTF